MCRLSKCTMHFDSPSDLEKASRGFLSLSEAQGGADNDDRKI